MLLPLLIARQSSWLIIVLQASKFDHLYVALLWAHSPVLDDQRVSRGTDIEAVRVVASGLFTALGVRLVTLG